MNEHTHVNWEKTAAMCKPNTQCMLSNQQEKEKDKRYEMSIYRTASSV